MYVGIDLGTSNSAIAGVAGSDVRIFKTAEGSDTLPSVIYIDKRGHRLYGQRAYAQTLLSPDNVAAGFKRLMGTSTGIEFAASGVVMSPEECSAEILRQLVGQVMSATGEDTIEGAVVTIPAAFNQMQCEATIKAAGLAGLDRVALLQEPIAASMGCLTAGGAKSGQFLVYDLGGGTFDLALVQSLAGAVNVLGHDGINMLGGKDFDRTILNQVVRPWLVENFDLPEDFQRDPKYRRIVRIAQLAAERAKIGLSTSDAEVIFASDEEVRAKDAAGADIYLDVPFRRADLEDLVRGEITQTIELARRLLKANGYGPQDIDRIVFVGGPTIMPCVRERIPQELGIPADIKSDPMTSVAVGAAVYAESREWSDGTTRRKAARQSVETREEVSLRYDFPARSSDNRARVRIRTRDGGVPDGTELQIDSTAGWTSGRRAVEDGMTLEVPLEDMGANAFRVTVFDGSGRPLSGATSTIEIMRTHASATGIPATQTIAVKVRESVSGARNVLDPLIKKGTLLPASGVKSFRAGRDLEAGERGHLDFELYQDEGVPEPELNLCIGAFRVEGKDIPDRTRIRVGDEIIFQWSMSDSGLLSANVELPSVAQSFATPKFYAPQAGHQQFDLEVGSQLANAMLKDAREELESCEQALGDRGQAELRDAEQQLEQQEEILRQAHDEDTTRSVSEAARRLRQEIARVRLDPSHRTQMLQQRLAEQQTSYNRFCRESADAAVSDRFDDHGLYARRAIDRGDEKGLGEAEAHLDEMATLYWRQLWQDPGYIVALFQRLAQEPFRATDREAYDALLVGGAKALERGDIDELRRTIAGLWDLQINLGGVDKDIARLATIVRG